MSGRMGGGEEWRGEGGGRKEGRKEEGREEEREEDERKEDGREGGRRGREEGKRRRKRRGRRRGGTSKEVGRIGRDGKKYINVTEYVRTGEREGGRVRYLEKVKV